MKPFTMQCPMRQHDTFISGLYYVLYSLHHSQPMCFGPKTGNMSFCLTFCIRLLSLLDLSELSYLTISVCLNLTFSELVIYLHSMP